MIYTENLNLPIVEDDDSMSLVYTQGNETNQKLDEKFAGYDSIPTTLNSLQESVNGVNAEVTTVKNDMENLENVINENVNATLSDLNSEVDILKVKSLKGGISFHVQNADNFSRTNPQLIQLTNADINANFKDVLQERNRFEFSFKNVGKYHLMLTLPVHVLELEAVGALQLILCKYPYTNGSATPNITDMVNKAYIESSGNLILDVVVNITNLNDYYGFVLSASAYKEGNILTEDVNDKLATLYVERIS